jgi:hypothetical protein
MNREQARLSRSICPFWGEEIDIMSRTDLLIVYDTVTAYEVIDLLVERGQARYTQPRAGEMAAAIHIDSKARLYVPLSEDRIVAPRFLLGIIQRVEATIEELYASP